MEKALYTSTMPSRFTPNTTTPADLSKTSGLWPPSRPPHPAKNLSLLWKPSSTLSSQFSTILRRTYSNGKWELSVRTQAPRSSRSYPTDLSSMPERIRTVLAHMRSSRSTQFITGTHMPPPWVSFKYTPSTKRSSPMQSMRRIRRPICLLSDRHEISRIYHFYLEAVIYFIFFNELIYLIY